MLLFNKRIFYVEDNLENRSIVQLILERDGAKLQFERWGGEDVIKRLEAFAPVDLILLDLMFPRNVSGYDVFDHIRAVPSLNHVPIVALSAADPTIEIPKAKAKGFHGFISKPVNMLTLGQQIHAILEGQAVWADDYVSI